MAQRTNQIVAVFAVILIGVGGLLVTLGLMNLDNPGTITNTDTTTTDTTTDTTTTDTNTDTTTTDTTTTTTTTTTDTTTDTTTTDTTTTTTTTVLEHNTLYVLTSMDTAVQDIFESAFLATDFADENNITEIYWRGASPEFWDDVIDAGEIDVCWGGTPSMYDQLMIDERLSHLNSTLMQEVQSRVNDTIAGTLMKGNNTADQLCWIASKLSSFGFTVNHDFLTTYSLPVPTTWADLAGPVYGTLLPAIRPIAMGNAPYTTSHTRIYEIIVQLMGWEAGWTYLSRVAGNADIYFGSVESQSQVESGNAGVSMSIDFYGFRSQYINPDCEYIVPEDGTLIEGEPIAIVNTSTQKLLGEGFIDFVLSSYGQSLLLDSDILRLPIMREAFDEPGAAGMDYMYSVFNQTCRSTSIDFNETLSLAISHSFMYYFESVLTYAHTELVNCWNAMVNRYYDGIITEPEFEYYADLMGDTVTIIDPNTSIDEEFTLDYAIRMNNDMIYNSTYRSTVQTRWINAAKVQYATVLSILPPPSHYLTAQTTVAIMMGSLQAILTLFIGTSGFVVMVNRSTKYD